MVGSEVQSGGFGVLRHYRMPGPWFILVNKYLAAPILPDIVLSALQTVILLVLVAALLCPLS